MLTPVRTAVRGSWPIANMPTLHTTVLPTITTAAIARAGSAYWVSMTGSIFRPIATKNSAANMSRSGSIRCMTFSALRASATTAPTRKAPSATLNPIQAASRLAPKHKPSVLTSSISLRPKPAT